WRWPPEADRSEKSRHDRVAAEVPRALVRVGPKVVEAEVQDAMGDRVRPSLGRAADAGLAENVPVGSHDRPLSLRDTDVVLRVAEAHRVGPGPCRDPPEQTIRPDEMGTGEPLRVGARRPALTGTRHGARVRTSRPPPGGGGRA